MDDFMSTQKKSESLSLPGSPSSSVTTNMFPSLDDYDADLEANRLRVQRMLESAALHERRPSNDNTTKDKSEAGLPAQQRVVSIPSTTVKRNKSRSARSSVKQTVVTQYTMDDLLRAGCRVEQLFAGDHTPLNLEIILKPNLWWVIDKIFVLPPSTLQEGCSYKIFDATEKFRFMIFSNGVFQPNNDLNYLISLQCGTIKKRFTTTHCPDVLMQNGLIWYTVGCHQCVTAMREYCDKSLEELRLEDYDANRKGKQGADFLYTNSTYQQQIEPGTTITIFTPRKDLDVSVKGGVTFPISTKHQCITAMKEYEDKSLEELRLLDYTLFRHQTTDAMDTLELIVNMSGTFVDASADTSGSDLWEGQGFNNMKSWLNSKEKEKSVSNTNICHAYLVNKCKKCDLLHSNQKLPYQWEFQIHGKWITSISCDEVEQAYCNNSYLSSVSYMMYENVNIAVEFGFAPYIQACLTISSGYSECVEARRLSTMSYETGIDECGSFKTQWRWYWQESSDSWKLFEPDLLQYTLETKYAADQNEFYFFRDTRSYMYKIDFKEMIQTNLHTNTRRNIFRRPLFVSVHDVSKRKYPFKLQLKGLITTPLPPSWVTWDHAHPFELVNLPKGSNTFFQMSDMFFTTLDKRQKKIKNIFHLQNRHLWTVFCNQEQIMNENCKKDGYKSVDKRYLFHGTTSMDSVKGICINNIDPRVCGKHGTVYGEGAYFAKDATYSDKYTEGPLKLMFVASVLVGRYIKGESSFKRPPQKKNGHELYDSCVNDVKCPTIFIVFERSQYYPEFLITYCDC